MAKHTNGNMAGWVVGGIGGVGACLASSKGMLGVVRIECRNWGSMNTFVFRHALILIAHVWCMLSDYFSSLFATYGSGSCGRINGVECG